LGYLVDLFMAPSSQGLEPPTKPGRFNRWPTRLDLELALVTYIGWYNARRRHRSLKHTHGGRTRRQAPLQVLEQYNQQASGSLVPKKLSRRRIRGVPLFVCAIACTRSSSRHIRSRRG
jgi:hypothetical protein